MEKNSTIKVSASLVNALKESGYFLREWVVTKRYTLEELQAADSRFKYLQGNPVIIAKKRNDGKLFNKMLLFFSNGTKAEFELTYKKEDAEVFQEGDEIALETLKFCQEECLEQSHWFMTGKVIE